MEIAQIDHVAIAVRDVGRSVQWYCDVLGMERRHREWGTMPAMVCAGETCVALFPVEGGPSPPPGRDAIAMRHIAFCVDRGGFGRAQEELRDRGIAFEFMDHETAHSIYFSDPDGHRLEITTYELGNGRDLFWHAHDAFNRGDREAFVAVWHAQCEYRPAFEADLQGAEGVYRGRDGVRLWWDRIHEDFREIGTRIESFEEVAAGRGYGVVVLHAKGAASGLAFNQRVGQLATYRGGCLISSVDFFDVEEGWRAARR